MTMTELPQQHKFSDRLQFLNRCEFSVDEPNELTQGPKVQRFVRRLETLAVSLCRKPGDVVAAALDQRNFPPTLFLSRNEPNEQDTAITQELIAILVDPKTTTYREVFPFLVTHCRAKIQHHIDKLHEALESDDLIPPSSYEWDSIGKECPAYRRFPVEIHQYEPSDIFESLLSGTQEACGRVKLDADDIQHSLSTFIALSDFSDMLSYCRPLQVLMSPSMQRLVRKLRKVIQYGFGITALVRGVNRLFPTGEIPFQWVTPPVLPAAISPHSCEELLFGHYALSPNALVALKRCYPGLNDWKTIYQPRIHCTIAIISHLHQAPRSAGESHLGLALVGCSKRICFCCHRWISAFNREHCAECRWVTGATNGKPDESWGVPPGYPNLARLVREYLEGMMQFRLDPGEYYQENQPPISSLIVSYFKEVMKQPNADEPLE
ncbi:hypothetical protein C8J56DRAFT_226346 [Mycena floridula]|nr:hypothetical protein C8J56DRAFT_226346 [Mycena floridula]